MEQKEYQKGFEYKIGSETFYLPQRYQPIELIGSGAYGAVLNAYDSVYSRNVAIKKLKPISDAVDLKRILREIVIMKNVNHENIIELYDIIFHPNLNNNHNEGEIPNKGIVYLVMEKMDSDLQRVICSQQTMEKSYYQFILYQILRALYYLHSANIVHRDFKPSNVLINEDCTIKLCDFGMSRNLSENEMQLTEYVVTRYYRAPEIMLNSHHYTNKIDVWSVGCTFAELLTKKFLFPGQNYIEQIKLIINLLGSPSEEDLNFISNSSAKSFVLKMTGIPKKNFHEFINYDDPEAVNLLEKMLVFNPEKRISIEEAIQSKYILDIKEGVNDPVFEGKINLEFDEIKNPSYDDLLKIFLEEIKRFDTGIIV